MDGKFYDDIINEWISHYLYGVENGAENRPAILVQMNYDQRKWETADSWETAYNDESYMRRTGNNCDRYRLGKSWCQCRETSMM